MEGILRNMTSVYLSRDDGCMLLLYRVGSRVVSPSWCGIGGHFEKDELNDARACALRELREEIGICEDDLADFRLRYVTLRLKNGEIRQNYYFFADLRLGAAVYPVCEEGTLAWIPRGEVLKKEMPFTAKYVLEHYITVGEHSSALYGGFASEEGVSFTALAEF